MDYLKECIEQNRIDIISDFIRNLSDINAVLIHEDDCNLNLLHFVTAVDSINRDDVIKLILTVDELDINKHSGPGNDYFTAAHIAACFGYTTTLKVLLENGADPYLLDKENNTVWDIAAFRNNYNCILVLESEISKPEPSPRKQIDESIYFSLVNIKLEDDDDDDSKEKGDETIKSSDDSEQSVVCVKAVENHVINKVEEKLCQRSPATPRSAPIKPFTPRKLLQGQSPLRDCPSKKTPSKDSPAKGGDTPTKKSPPRKIVPRKSPPRKERKPKITKKQVDSLNDTIYTDEDFNVTLIESCDSALEPIDPLLQQLTDQEVRQQLMGLGQSPGPINDTTRNAYLRKLKILKSASVVTNSPAKPKQLQPLSPLSPLSPFKPLPAYSPYINAILLNRFKFKESKKLEEEFVEKFFSNPIGPTDFFVYLLLDPRKYCPSQPSNNKIDNNPFVRFIKSIFYIGKGKNNRPYMHLYEAAAPAKNNKPISAKVKLIQEIWDQGLGVISLHIVIAMSSNEAYARESLMIDAIGINKLTNIRSGQQKINWPEARRMTLGTHFIYNAYANVKTNGVRQIRRVNIR
ncbi:ankyrin repeat and LEM domain-containing protein 1-like [Panonychus citri]|uniref:ankyrin repeat and LEM domain-containing protein 1-like n=1 Tax=Panonychus citri TaxID=50023 RepID=UPI0023070931|nr:ankyrin repeat and LEM domain-containing protein 1-like [Panonychus citri]